MCVAARPKSKMSCVSVDSSALNFINTRIDEKVTQSITEMFANHQAALLNKHLDVLVAHIKSKCDELKKIEETMNRSLVDKIYVFAADLITEFGKYDFAQCACGVLAILSIIQMTMTFACPQCLAVIHLIMMIALLILAIYVPSCSTRRLKRLFNR